MTSSNNYVNSEASALGRMVQEAEVKRLEHNKVRDEAKLVRSREMERIRREQDAEESGSRSSKSYYSRPPTSSSRLHTRRDSDHANDCGGQGHRELRSQITELESKLKTTMVTSAQLDNEKQTLRYEVDLQKDHLEELKDTHTLLLKQYTEQKRDFSYQRMQIAELQSRVEWQQQQLFARDQLIEERGLVVIGDTQKPGSTALNGFNGDHPNTDDKDKLVPAAITLVSPSTAERLNDLPEGSLESRILALFTERTNLVEKINQLEASQRTLLTNNLRSSPHSSSPLGRDRRGNGDSLDGRGDNKSSLKDYKDKLEESSDKIASMEKEITVYKDKILRMESQAKRSLAASETSERLEEELKQEKRKLQRENRDLQNKLEDHKSENSLLQRRLDNSKKSTYS